MDAAMFQDWQQSGLSLIVIKIMKSIIKKECNKKECNKERT